MYLYKLKPLIKKMNEENKTVISFEYIYNEQKVKIVFYNLEDMIISIIKDKDFITFLINKDFSINTKLSTDNYKLLVKMLNIKFDEENPFNPHSFFFDLSQKIKNFDNCKIEKGIYFIRYIKDYIDDSFKNEFIRFIDNKDGHKVSRHNLNKTALFFGKKKHLYCKKNNVSSVWKKRNKK